MNSDIFDSESDSEYGFCNVSKIKLQGELMPYIPNEDKNEDGSTAVDATSSEDIVDAIEIADNDENIQAIILEINSFGGGPVAAEEVANALKRATKPTVALIRGMGVSAAYWSAIGADVIIASANSDVGSIGITSSYLDNTEKNEKEGLTFNQISTGKFKDMLNSVC
ncbi:MAG: S49 family peptidase [Minisyncoccia bacterium]